VPRMRRFKPTYANVTATLALFVALGGGAYAATALPADSVGGRQVKDGSLRAVDFAPGQEPITQVVRRHGRRVAIAASHSGEATAYCRKGERALGGGGFDETGFHDNFVLFASLPRAAGEGRIGEDDEPNGWEVRYFNRADHGDPGDDSVIEVGAYVVCGR
jgi:hypothetical protein